MAPAGLLKGITSNDFTFNGTREKDHKGDSRGNDATKGGNHGEEISPHHAFVDVLVRTNSVNAENKKWGNEEEAESNTDGVKLVEFGQAHNGGAIHTLSSEVGQERRESP